MGSRHSQSRRKRSSGPVTVGFPAQARLFDLHAPPDRMYLLRSGQVQLSHGREAIVDYLAPGDVFGEKCLLVPPRRSQIATALSPIRVAVFRPSELPGLLRQNPGLVLRLFKNLTLRLDRYEEALRDCVAETVERRLARLLFRFLPARANSGWVRLRFSPSNPELAKTVGTTRWRIAHFMSRFQRLGWLDRRPDLWARAEGLRKFLESPPGAS